MELSPLNQHNLKFEFPNLFTYLFEDNKETTKFPISKGIQCGDGWVGLLYSFSMKLTTLINKLSEEERSLYYITQIREVSGSLKIQLSKYTKEIENLVKFYEKKSIGMCEVCGEEGYLLNHDGERSSRCFKH